MVFDLIAYGGVGIVAGILAGLLGISGGLVTIPCLILIFRFLDFPPVYIMQLAIGTSLAAMVFNAIASTWFHHCHGSVIWSLVKKMSLGVVIGSIVGAAIGDALPTSILELIFGVFAVALGIHFYRQKELIRPEYAMPGTGTLNSVAFGLGAISTILGIGGGSMAVPLFVGYRLPIKKAVGTSAAMGTIISFIGAISYLIFGLNEAFYSYSIGYIYLPAFAILSVTTFITAPIGVRLTYVIPSAKLKRYFAFALIAIGVTMMLR